jgi:O-antigen biosynthesis protein
LPRSGAKPLRIAMIPTANGGVNYYRMAAWAFQMRKYRNIEVALFAFQYGMVEVHPWQRDFSFNPYVRHDIEHLIKAADVVIWQPVHYQHTLEFFNEMRHKYGKLTLVETDDNFIDVPPWNEAFKSYSPNSYHRHAATQCFQMADGLIVSTPHLKELYSQFNDNIHVIENSIDFKGDSKFLGWDTVSVRKHKGLRIGWIGGRSHFNDLMMIAPVLREILIEHPKVTLSLVNSAIKPSCASLNMAYPFEGIKNVIDVDKSVPITRYAKFFAHQAFDIGLAPLVDCNFNRSKSNLRWLEYSALKIPCVATDISHFSQTIKNGTDGILVKDNNLESWKKNLAWLIQSKQLRENIGKAAYRRAKSDFNIKRNAAKYARLLKELVGSSGVVEEDECNLPICKVS